MIPARLVPVARFLYRVLGLLTPPLVARVAGRIDFALANRPTRCEAQVLARNARFKNMYAGRRCFVIGNGPSLKEQDLSPLGDEITIVMNWFNKHPIIEQWKPTFYCMAEPRMDWAEEQLPRFLEKIDAQAYLYRIEYKELFDEHRWVDPDKVYYMKTGSVAWHEWLGRKHVVDLTSGVPGCQSTSLMPLLLALYIGCSPIYLLGLDHDWLAHRGMDKHFYEGKTIENHPQAAGDLSRYSYKADAQGVVDLWSGYEALLTLSRKTGSRILNATYGGFLDVFERVRYDDVIGTQEAIGGRTDSSCPARQR